MKYEIRQGLDGDILVQTTEDGIESFVPQDESNSAYQSYLKSLDEASTL